MAMSERRFFCTSTSAPASAPEHAEVAGTWSRAPCISTVSIAPSSTDTTRARSTCGGSVGLFP